MDLLNLISMVTESNRFVIPTTCFSKMAMNRSVCLAKNLSVGAILIKEIRLWIGYMKNDFTYGVMFRDQFHYLDKILAVTFFFLRVLHYLHLQIIYDTIQESHAPIFLFALSFCLFHGDHKHWRRKAQCRRDHGGRFGLCRSKFSRRSSC